MIPYGKQSVTDEDVAAVVDALQSGWLTTGPKVAEFEQRFATYVGAKHAVAVCNGTAALHLAMLAAEIGPNDRVVTSPNTFLASANCAAFVGAIPDFTDIDSAAYTLCPEKLLENWHDDTRAVIPIHYAGGSADMPTIAELARQRGAIVIEDACHAVGGSIEHQGKFYKIGGHPWADMAIFSFHPVKTMTSGEGGMLVTDDDAYADRARCLRSHGMIRNVESCVGLGSDAFSEKGPWYYEMQELGFNYRITDFQCALGISQLNRLDEMVARRQEIVLMYNEAFSACDNLSTPGLRNPLERDCTSWHLYTLLFNWKGIGRTRTQVVQQLAANGVGSQVLYIPVHLQPWYRKRFGYRPGKCPIAEDFYRRSLSIPLFSAMTDEEVDVVIEQVLKIVSPG